MVRKNNALPITSQSEPSLLKQLIVTIGCLTFQTKRYIFLVILFGLFSTFAEIINIGAIIPLIGILVAPETIITEKNLILINKFFPNFSLDNAQFIIVSLFSIATLLSAAVRQCLFFFQTRTMAKIGNDLSSNIYSKLMTQKFPYYIANPKNEMQSAIYNHADSVVDNAINPVITVINAAFILISISIIILFTAPMQVIAAILGIVAIYFALTHIYKKSLINASRVFASCNDYIIKLLQEGFNGIRDIILTNSHDRYLDSFIIHDRKKRKAKALISFIAIGPRVIIETIFLIGLAIAAYNLSKTSMGLTEILPYLGAFVFAAQKMLPLIQTTYASLTLIYGAKSSLLSIFNLLNLETIEHKTYATAPLKFQKINLNDVHFTYPNNLKPTLKKLTLEVKRGQKIAITGKSGSGKSTLLDIISGLITISDGVFIDGQALKEENRSSWQSNIAYLSQFTFIKNGTILENIIFKNGETDADLKRAVECAKHAEIFDDIVKLQDGFQTIIGDGGKTLSGGQIQRIGFARTLFKNSNLLILDEATSSLDVETEKKIADNISRFYKDTTVLISSHRVELLRICEKVYNLDSGELKSIDVSDI